MSNLGHNNLKPDPANKKGKTFVIAKNWNSQLKWNILEEYGGIREYAKALINDGKAHEFMLKSFTETEKKELGTAGGVSPESIDKLSDALKEMLKK